MVTDFEMALTGDFFKIAWQNNDFFQNFNAPPPPPPKKKKKWQWSSQTFRRATQSHLGHFVPFSFGAGRLIPICVQYFHGYKNSSPNGKFQTLPN